jgi:carbon storage regulator
VLVLTRRAGESIVIGDEVRVVVLDVRGDTVRLGIEAPRSVQVHRAEVYAEVQAANAAAVSRIDDLESVAGRLGRIARPKPRPPAAADESIPEQPTPEEPTAPLASD